MRSFKLFVDSESIQENPNSSSDLKVFKKIVEKRIFPNLFVIESHDLILTIKILCTVYIQDIRIDHLSFIQSWKIQYYQNHTYIYIPENDSIYDMKFQSLSLCIYMYWYFDKISDDIYAAKSYYHYPHSRINFIFKDFLNRVMNLNSMSVYKNTVVEF